MRALLMVALLLTGCEMPPHPCDGQLQEGWVRHIPTGEYRRFEVFDFSDAYVKAMDGSGAIYPPVCSEYEPVNVSAGTPSWP